MGFFGSFLCGVEYVGYDVDAASVGVGGFSFFYCYQCRLGPLDVAVFPFGIMMYAMCCFCF